MAENWFNNETLVSFDTETTGAYPVSWEVCEIGAVKWQAGEITETFAARIKPEGLMNPIAQKIHGITLEALQAEPSAKQVLAQFCDFVGDAKLVAHHAPFDMGFLSWELFRAGLPPLKNQVFCTSLIARNLFPKCKNHRLPTLIEYFDLNQLKAHQALDDARMCLDVFLKCLEANQGASWTSLQEVMGKKLSWKIFAIEELEQEERFKALLQACQSQSRVRFTYRKGSKPMTEREVTALGIVRNPDGDFFVGQEGEIEKPKRFYLKHVASSSLT